MVLYSDGVFDRREEGGGRFGLDGIEAAVTDARATSAAATARAIQSAVGAASAQPLADDATVLVFAVV